jgi:hypothetical protein
LSLCLINRALRHEDVWRSGGVAPPFLTLALDGGEWSASHPGRFTSGERTPGTRWTGGCVDPRAGLDTVEKRKISCLCRESNPRRPARSPCNYSDNNCILLSRKRKYHFIAMLTTSYAGNLYQKHIYYSSHLDSCIHLVFQFF